MNVIDEVVDKLKTERKRIDAALFALEGSAKAASATPTERPSESPSTDSTPVISHSTSQSTHRPRRTMSAKSRRKIARAQKKNWAEGGKRRTKGRVLTAETKKKIADSQKKRWAKAKASAAQAGQQSAAA